MQSIGGKWVLDRKRLQRGSSPIADHMIASQPFRFMPKLQLLPIGKVSIRLIELIKDVEGFFIEVRQKFFW